MFFDRSDRVLGSPSLTRYDTRTGLLHSVTGAQHDHIVCNVSQDGKRLILRSAERLTVRGYNRSRITVLVDGMPPRTTNRVFSHWSVFDPSGRYALVGTLSATARSLAMDTAICDPVATARPRIDARFGELDPIDGRLWVPHTRFASTVLSVDCATGSASKVRLPVGNRIVRVRFARNGSSFLAVGEKGTLSRHRRDGSVVWLVNVSGIGRVGAGDLFLNGARRLNGPSPSIVGRRRGWPPITC